MATFTPQNIPDLADKTAIVTGASSGIGLSTARALAAAGARIVFAAATPRRAARPPVPLLD
jgi:NAD(P)-dependent dehydrogenase (short-subunit alcohol dehydrogenase family)